MILGIDEVGRGVWAGPLVVGAVIIGDAKIDGLTDSKVLSRNARIKLDAEIRNSSATIGLGWVSAGEIDEIGLSSALRLATRRAVEEVQSFKQGFSEIIIDGTINFLTDTRLSEHVTTIKKADLLIQSVSAASIVAKVARDGYMADQAAKYPSFGFEQHVGYGTVQHRIAIEKNGVTPLHRLSIGPLKKYANQKPIQAAVNGNHKTTRKIGDGGETAAAKELESRGHQIVARNWKTKYCEIDIVSIKGDIYFFTEVKHRKNSSSGDGLAAITKSKQRQMDFAARMYMQKHKINYVKARLTAISTSGDVPVVEEYVELD